MDINVRLKELRKKLNLSQTDFGSQIGLTTAAISDIERGKVKTVTEGNIKLVCSVYHVNEQWIRSGEGDMFENTYADLIEEVAKESTLTDDDRFILEMYLDMTPDERKKVTAFIKSLIDGTDALSIFKKRMQSRNTSLERKGD